MAGITFTPQLAVVVGTGLTTLIECPMKMTDEIFLKVINGAVAFNAFQIQAKAGYNDDTYLLLYSSSTAGGLILDSNTQLATLGVGISGWLSMYAGGASAVRFQASVAAGTSTCVVRASAN